MAVHERLLQPKEASARWQRCFVPAPCPHSTSHPQTSLGLGDAEQNQGQQQVMLGTPRQREYKAGSTWRGTLWGKQASEKRGSWAGWLAAFKVILSLPCRMSALHPLPCRTASAPSAALGGRQFSLGTWGITPAGPQGSQTHQMLLLSQ